MSARPADPMSLASDTIDDLLARCAAGDHAAFRSLYDGHSSRLYGLALRLTRQPQIASDVVHDTLMQVWRHAGRFDPERGAGEAWLATLLRYRAIDAMRRVSREDVGAEVPELADTAPDPLEALTTRADASALHVCLDKLEPAQRKVVTMAFVEGLSHSQLATVLDAPLGTVKSWVRRALHALRRCLDA